MKKITTTFLIFSIIFIYIASPKYAYAAFSLVANTGKQAVSGEGPTTDAIDTTGANLIVIGVTWYSQVQDMTLSDSKGNTWTPLTQVDKDDWTTQMFYAYAPTVGSGHTFTAGGSATYSTIEVSAWSGAASSPFDQQSTFQTNGSSIQPGSITPTEDNELVVTHFGQRDNANPGTVNSGYTITDAFGNLGGHALGGSMAYIIQTSAAATNPTWSTDSGGLVALIASFKAGADVADEVPTVVTDFASNINGSSGNLNGTKTGGDDATQHGFAWGTNSGLNGGDTATTTLGAKTSNSPFTSTVSLSNNTTYYFRAYGTNAAGTGYGIIRSFYSGNSTATRKMILFQGSTIKLFEKMIIHQQ